jgi:hypothetical protein
VTVISEDDVLDLRIRNRIIEALELTASLEKQFVYERSVPIAQVPAEVICQWKDTFGCYGGAELNNLIYSKAEIEAADAFQIVWDDVCSLLPHPLPNLTTLTKDTDWLRLLAAARAALAVFMVRGRLSEDLN